DQQFDPDQQRATQEQERAETEVRPADRFATRPPAHVRVRGDRSQSEPAGDAGGGGHADERSDDLTHAVEGKRSYHDRVTGPALSTIGDDALVALLAAGGYPPWRAAQLREATWQPSIDGPAAMRQLPAAMRIAVAEAVTFSTTEVAQCVVADSGATLKLVCRLGDGQSVETVAMESPARGAARRRATVCVSTQVGCAVGCPFCATGHMGLRRSCTAAEIV